MATIRFNYDPSKIPNVVEGRYPLKPIRQRIEELYRLLSNPVSIFGGGTGTGGTGTGPAADLATRVLVSWKANGPYPATATAVDGYWRVLTPCEIRAIGLSRSVPGSAGSTVLDLKRIPAGSTVAASLYLTTANRPTITYAQITTACNLPDVITLAAGDIVYPDILSRESGVPRSWTLDLEAA